MSLATLVLERGTQFVRIFDPDAAYRWSTPRYDYLGAVRGGRFDHQLAVDRGRTATWYASEDLTVAVIELLHHYRSLAKVRTLHAVAGYLAEPATVLDLRGVAGPSGGPPLAADPDRARTQRRARELWGQHREAQGLFWRSRLVPSSTGTAFVLNERYFAHKGKPVRAFQGYPKRLTHPALESSVYAAWWLWHSSGEP